MDTLFLENHQFTVVKKGFQNIATEDRKDTLKNRKLLMQKDTEETTNNIVAAKTTMDMTSICATNWKYVV